MFLEGGLPYCVNFIGVAMPSSMALKVVDLITVSICCDLLSILAE